MVIFIYLFDHLVFYLFSPLDSVYWISLILKLFDQAVLLRRSRSCNPSLTCSFYFSQVLVDWSCCHHRCILALQNFSYLGISNQSGFDCCKGKKIYLTCHIILQRGSSRGRLEVEQWTDNRTLSISVGSNPGRCQKDFHSNSNTTGGTLVNK